ncbi:MAG TPA: hypothetical protein VLM84_13370 [Chromatiaceae bacterium]|nr:hypothetical protein [Chromatiaceae bacterium]
MYQTQTGAVEPLADYRIDPNPMRYSQFVPRLYGLCLGLGMEQGRIMPSRAFCSDESQGYPVILLAKHFGAFPFNHGQVGGIVATDRHGPHAHHGQDLVILQASHVGYDADTGTFGIYRRVQSATHECTTSCGKICGVLDWYAGEYRFAQDHILIAQGELGPVVIVDNLLVRQDREEGLMLHMARLVRFDAEGHPSYVQSLSTAKVFHMADGLAARLAGRIPATPTPIGERLTPDLFYFRRKIQSDEEGRGHLELNLIRFMPQIVTAPAPALTAAKINTQIEFDRAYRTLVQEPAYRGKRLLFVAGLNVDVSPTPGRIFPLTKFIPWAAYWQRPDGHGETWEQDEVLWRLAAQPTDNPHQVDLEAAIHEMEQVEGVTLRLP